MKFLALLAANCFFLLTVSLAAEIPAVQEGTEKYDWQSCVDDKSSQCLNACANSEELDCQDNCIAMAKDKCQSDGINKPVNQTLD